MQGRLQSSDTKPMLEDRIEELKSEKLALQNSCLAAYEEGFKEAMCQAVHFSPSLDVNKFDLEKVVIDDNLIDD